jgi:hypothetical protein
MTTLMRSLRVLFFAVGALVFVAAGGGYLLSRPAIADFLQTIPGTGTTFAAVVIGGKQYVAHAVCDWVIGESQCANVTAAGQLSVTGPVSGTGAAGAAFVGNPVRVGISDATNTHNWNNAASMTDANVGTNWAAGVLAFYNGTTFDRVRGDITNGLWPPVSWVVRHRQDHVMGAVHWAMATGSIRALLSPSVNVCHNTNANGPRPTPIPRR